MDLSSCCVQGIGDVCCLPSPAHPPFASNCLGPGAPDDTYSKNVRASDTLNLGHEGIVNLKEAVYC